MGALVKTASVHPHRTLLTADIVRRIVFAVERGASIRIAADYAGITEDMLEAWYSTGTADPLSPYATLTRAIDHCRGKHAVRMLGVVNDAADRGDAKPAQWLLERVHGYTPRTNAAVKLDADSGRTRSMAELIRLSLLDDQDYGEIEDE